MLIRFGEILGLDGMSKNYPTNMKKIIKTNKKK
jgi:hypothetical protein